MSIENTPILPNNIKKFDPKNDIGELKDEITNGAKFFELRDTIEGSITVKNLENYQKSFKNLVKNYYGQEGNGVPDDEIERVYQIGKEKIKIISDILDALIELYYLKKTKLNKEVLYKKGTIIDLMKKLGYKNKNQVLDESFFNNIDDRLGKTFDNIGKQAKKESATKVISSQTPQNSIEKWFKELDSTNTTYIDTENSLELLKLIVTLNKQKITSDNFEDYKKSLANLISLIDGLDLDSGTIEVIRNLSRKFFDVILIKNILLELYPNATSSELLQIYQNNNNKESPLIFDSNCLDKLINKTRIVPDIHNIIMDKDEQSLMINLENFLNSTKKTS